MLVRKTYQQLVKIKYTRSKTKNANRIYEKIEKIIIGE